MTRFTRRQALALSLGAATLAAMPAQAQDAAFPSRPIRIIVPFSAGGVVDSTARIVAEKLGAKYGHAVIVENKTGAGGAIGTELVAKSASDGYTLLAVSPSHAVLPSVVKNLSWSPVRDFRAVQGFGVVPNLLVVLPSMPVKTLSELLALAKKSSEPLSYATAGVGTSNHLSGELLAQMAGVKLTHVPYRGQSDAMNDLLGGRVTMMPLTVAIAGPYVKAGKLRALAITTAKRATAFPDLPTVAEAAQLPGYEVGAWFGLVAPSKAPDSVVRKLLADVAAILAMPDVKAKLATLGMEMAPRNPAEFDAFVADEAKRWNQVLKQAGVEPQ
ncbi:tripartite tricarboxylate transporter substrate binding protein [Acidovorax sp. Be4]|uniref:Tripartite tricarboxylate transporter substrate binding protein n=1 Tax=Acidovorax bellezanensis TaxID=2976702 RepID=A0ABT2PMC3_9BURK|nr:tripartite tricarboxylate transporter substrate binding protein [Acidovorax sp. Be4]MCT9810979.1 tripartite tricarboxylate transporter substrate binding protein [Acidovorax sp. Be4]